MERKYLSTHIYFRNLRKEDWKDVHDYASLESVSEFQSWGPNHVNDTIAYVEDALNAAKVIPKSRYVHALVDERVDKVIGAGEIIINSFTNRAGEVGYILHPDYWGKGIGTLVGKALVNKGFSELKLHRISATCHPQNISSQKVLIKIGMTLEGRIRHHMKLNEGWRDSLLYGILENEWTGG
ncbi:GNAT family N-acetyltransferase [Rossellomorea aquimaris]|uniref:GNAT family N-acetyltransferase n=2 Tax=Rossellomorea TaxID=2837508 RepID=UPI001CD5DA3E|nr:GNAT family protein [Rossellomorea aquimaris]MCA1059431.1 GNAT family N-acetyltransferase [Rossellomorea aquimaris]